MPTCCVKGCKNRSGQRMKCKPIRFFSFPKNDKFRKIWLERSQANSINVKHARICSIHFQASCYQNCWLTPLLGFTPKTRRVLKSNAIPTEFLNISTFPFVHDTSKYIAIKEEIDNSSVETSTWIDMDRQKVSSTIDVSTASTNMATNYETQSTTVQTDIEKISTRRYKAIVKENYRLRCQLKLQSKQFKSTLEQKVKKILSGIFTPGQIKMLLNPTIQKMRWSANDIASAISLRSVSPKAYRYLRNVLKIPLPSLLTLRKWVSTSFCVNEGILTDVFKIMTYKGRDMSNIDKLTVISFDEIHLSNVITIDRQREQVIGPHKRCQIIFARGLLKNWKQPVFYKFDQDITKDILTKVIRNLYDIDFIVIAVTCDLSPSNQKLLKELGIGIQEHEKCYFQHPSNDALSVFVFADPPHLIKLARNHYIDQGFNYNGECIKKSCLEKLLAINSENFKITHKLTQSHLDVAKSDRQKVKIAAQLFSNTNAAAVEWCGLKGFLESETWLQTAFVLKLFNDWFDVFNSTHMYGNHPGLNAYGIDLKKQNDILEKMTLFIQKVKVGNHKTLFPFQKGILLCNSSLKNLYEYLKQSYNITKTPVYYILCNRLNQDVIENFFSYIREMGSEYDHPTPLEFRNRLRWYILGKNNTDVFTEDAIIENHDSTELCLTNCYDILDQCTSESNTTLEDVEFILQQVIKNELNHSEQNELNHDEEAELNFDEQAELNHDEQAENST